MISTDEVLKIAKLARLELNKREVEKMQKDLSAILEYFNLLKKAPKFVKSKTTSKFLQSGNATRKDEVIENPASLANNLVQQAPDKKDGYVKVKAIL